MLFSCGIDKLKLSQIMLRNPDDVHYGAKYHWELSRKGGEVRRILRLQPCKYYHELCIYHTIEERNGESIICNEHVELEILASGYRGDNIIPLTYTEYRRYVEDVIKYIAREHGIVLDLRMAEIKEIELNFTFALSDKFLEYDRPLALMRAWQNRTLVDNRKAQQKDKYDYAPVVISNSRREITYYLKVSDYHAAYSRGTCEKVDILRIEERIKKKDAIRQALGTEDLRWYAMNDTIFIGYFIAKATEYAKKSNDWKVTAQKRITKLIQEMVNKNPKTWQYDILQYCRNDELYAIKYNKPHVLLDVKQLYDVIDNMPDPNHNRSRVKRAIERKKIEGVNDAIFRGDGERLDDIITSLYKCKYGTMVLNQSE